MREQHSCAKEIHPLWLWAELMCFFRRNPFERLRHYRKEDLERPRNVDSISGAFICVRSDVFRGVGGFDEQGWKNRLYCEEDDLCKRIRDQGHKLTYLPIGRSVHIGGESSKRMHPIKRRHMEIDSQLYYAQKHWNPLTAWIMRLTAGVMFPLWATYQMIRGRN
jgi:GT2 family glycosyltransferase